MVESNKHQQNKVYKNGKENVKKQEIRHDSLVTRGNAMPQASWTQKS